MDWSCFFVVMVLLVLVCGLSVPRLAMCFEVCTSWQGRPDALSPSIVCAGSSRESIASLFARRHFLGFSGSCDSGVVRPPI
ncbi:hypothetical protein M011DRAFT_60120 [Sporormia fimetaria CBS 119925]|uniref:Secreted protein n=1 Tax=Sporormia fimetaria CBS 119925 TaxID=1340428 RepID=A0A6A6V8S5_9PLEO|nr:hypothetical protein M011DRAFT_60120 [Sporormia fimetaria CBS 119925]